MIRQELRHLVKTGGRGLFFIGIALVVLGVLAIGTPFVAAMAVQMALGFLLLCAGVVWLCFAVRSRSWGSGFREGLIGILAVIGGLLVMDSPLVSLAMMTLVLGIWFGVSGIFRIVLAFHMKPVSGWGWTLFNGLVSLLLGLMVARHWPSSALPGSSARWSASSSSSKESP